jgi:anti-sigma factor ChrR (cupin superfamily)
LLIEPDTGLLTALVRMAPGSTLPDHQHVQIEQTYVIDGNLVDEDGTVGTGQFVWRPAGSRHAAHAPEGALILGIFIKPNRFFDSAGDTTDMLGRDYDSTWS